MRGNVVIEFLIEPQNRISGYINFTNYPGVTTLCGAGNFTGIRQGRTLRFNFVSNDPDPGCGFDRGLKIVVSATLSPDNSTLENGSYQVNNRQAGVFTASSSTPAQDDLSKLQSEVFKRGKSPEDVNRAMSDKFPNSSFPYYEPANGCSTPKGISWGWGNNDLFKSACDNHDICYTTPGNPKGYCDKKMLSEMFKICENGSSLCKSWAQDYYSAVNLGAQGAYDTAQKQEREYIKAVYAWLSRNL